LVDEPKKHKEAEDRADHYSDHGAWWWSVIDARVSGRKDVRVYRGCRLLLLLPAEHRGERSNERFGRALYFGWSG
jgi:hypothetical protein